MEFSTSLEEILNMYKSKQKTYTENGAVSYASSGKSLLDFNFSITTLRSENWKNIGNEFSKAFYENPEVATVYWFYCMDVMEGLGERNITKGIMLWMIENHPEIVEKVMKFISNYNRWDTFILLCDPNFNKNEELRKKALYILKMQFIYDLKKINVGSKESISLLGKWMPSENASSNESKRMARQLMRDWNIKPRNYRKALVLLRKRLNVVECSMSANEWFNINYNYVPSKANLNYSNAFMRHDEERRQEYLASLKNGNAKINSKVLAPYEIVRDYRYNSYSATKVYDETLEQLWKNLPNYQLNDVLVIRDGSGSMTDRVTGNTTCLDIATSLAIYAAEHNSKQWKNKFITFSSNPEFVNMQNCRSLREKIVLCNRYDDCSNTDIYKTMKLILNTAISNGYKQKEMPKSILIISDMQFDNKHEYSLYSHYKHGMFNYDETLFESIKTEYMAAGYKLPKIIFWNVDSRGNKTIPMQSNELGMMLVSGFSANIFKAVLGDEFDPYLQLLKILNNDRYKPVREALLA